jgi:hypothetical protein
MPTISFFYGIAIRMYFRDHAPAHFHAIYGEHEAFISIETGEVIFGHLPKRQQGWLPSGRLRGNANSAKIGSARK